MRSVWLSGYAPLVATALIISLVGIGGLAGAQHAQLDDGNATVDVVAPTGDRLAVESGRFTTAADYLRLPDLVVDVSSVSGTPRIHYRQTVPELGIDRQNARLIRREGRIRVPLADVAYPPTGERPEPGEYDGRVLVRVQSFSTDTVVANRSIRIGVPE
jgi:hypothetical protein